MDIKFTKMHGLGNDFLVINNMDGSIKLSKEKIILLCDRHFGIGADGVILVESSGNADCFMNYYNSDGSIAEMCGNGVRCTAKFFYDDILSANSKQTSFDIDTRAGIKHIELLEDGTFSVKMGTPDFLSKDFPEHPLELEGLELNFVSIGNPHAVALVDNLEDYDLSSIGPKIENDSHFPNKINFELVEAISPKEFKVKVWERACGATLACGTGACAVYAVLRKYKNTPVQIMLGLPGGNLFMSENDKGEIMMRGPAVSVFKGEIKC